ncbi:MAG TPA: type IV pili methyl-accepting chemotaxis transducer N-terminal domain-containing protein [Albitalea sp.]|nr:type IV pili methyl-accepting chemotaxis transducer N-terminal domain-containing protein [Albitalea sp.]
MQRSNLVQEAVRLEPDLVVFHEASVSDALFDSATLLLATSPRPIVVFTNDPDVDKMQRALQAGIHAYEVNGYGVQRLRAVLHMAQLRFAHEQQLRKALADVSHRFEERKLVDRAKGILMRARQVSEDEAFRVLRAASMHSNQRVGQVSQQVIAAANYAEAVNRAGQLRMLSQRLVKLYALRVNVPAAPREELLRESSQRIDGNLAALAKSLSKATYGDLIDAVMAPWTQLKGALSAPVDVVRLAEVDALAERVLLQADRLVNHLETTGMASSLHVINVSGRQRMLSQRVAKQALLAVLLAGDAAAAARVEADKARAAFEEALAYLNGVPLSTREIRESLDTAGQTWGQMIQALERVSTVAGQQALGETSEALLALFEQLTERFERSMQMLMG